VEIFYLPFTCVFLLLFGISFVVSIKLGALITYLAGISNIIMLYAKIVRPMSFIEIENESLNAG
jgi:hypothetical protein